MGRAQCRDFDKLCIDFPKTERKSALRTMKNTIMVLRLADTHEEATLPDGSLVSVRWRLDCFRVLCLYSI